MRSAARWFLYLFVGASCVVFILWVPPATAAETVLPVGSQPNALQFDHFPDRLHAVVFRNWQLVDPARIAAAVGGTSDQIAAIAASMGLPPAERISPEFTRRLYITVLRRNWHLLPYEQLLVLLDMKADALAFALREDDFLFVKLGNLKPKCEPVRYSPPNEKTQQREAEIKALVKRHFHDELAQSGEARFQFIKEFSQPAPDAKPPPRPKPHGEQLRFIYSYCASFGDPLADDRLESYPDGLLARLAEAGVNGVWLHVVLRQMAPGGEAFPEFGENHQKRLANLRKLVERAGRHGIGVYLYINEPRAMPLEFFKDRPDMLGVREGDHATMCTSDPRVRRWLSDSLAHVFREVPDLGGVFTISASENLTNCASHGQRQGCPRCAKRSEAEILAEVNTTIAEGVERANPRAKVIVWDWGWHNHGDAADVIALLPRSVWLMSVSEWALSIERGGVRTTVGEYSLSSVGPGPRATRHWALAKDRGLKTVAKVQLNNTWELSSVPYLPVLDLVAEHCGNLAQAKTDGMLLSWSLGGYPSPNLRVAQAFARDPRADKDEVLDRLAADLYGESAAPLAREAWRAFSDAFRQYPYDGVVLYNAPQQMGPANLLYPRPTGYRATMVGIPYDDLAGWRGPYSEEVFAAQFEKVAAGWIKGVALLKQAKDRGDKGKDMAIKADIRIARASGLHFASVANQARFVMARNRLADKNFPEAERQAARAETLAILDREITLARELFTISRADSRIGFEASNQYYYVPLDLVEKVVNCEWLKGEVDGEQ